MSCIGRGLVRVYYYVGDLEMFCTTLAHKTQSADYDRLADYDGADYDQSGLRGQGQGQGWRQDQTSAWGHGLVDVFNRICVKFRDQT